MEIPRHWRLRKQRYSLAFELDANGHLVGSAPTGIRAHVEQQVTEERSGQQISADALMFESLAVGAETTE
jgi:hypothetical protein